jgi:tRNA (adenine37-N6)-methyltransferase
MAIANAGGAGPVSAQPVESPDAGVVARIIGRIRSPFVVAEGTPIQPTCAASAEGTVVLDPRFAGALDDIEGFERVWLVYWMDRADPYRARVVPYRDTREHGVLATRSPCRPNAIGMSAVTLLAREGNVLRVAGVDVLDGTPLLDLKPYVPEFDAHPSSRAGWFEEAGNRDRRTADGRFHQGHGGMPQGPRVRGRRSR